MPVSENRTFPVLPYRSSLTVAEVDRIAAITDPIIRNLEITQCYCELSAAFAKRAGPGANWCTFATWASKQAGQTIRREDLRRTLEALLKKEPEVDQALSVITFLAKRLGTREDLENIRQSVPGILAKAVTDRASDAVSRGNKKVFEEIAREFARFMSTCLDDTVYRQEHIVDFCKQLRSGDPPEGQEYLRRAFTRYYESLFETDPKNQAEKRLLANLEIGFHEQTRLQPEIAEALNTPLDQEWIKSRLHAILFSKMDVWRRSLLFFKRVFGKTILLDKAIESMVLRAQHHLRRLLTAHLMMLTLPPDCLRLGHDLSSVYPTHLQELANSDLVALLAQIDPTPDSLNQTGALDWADLTERMHFIADMFRCYQEEKELFNAAFSIEQQAALEAGKIPDGRL